MTSSEPQVVVVTGASGGIGRATAQAFGARGAKVALLARGELGLHGLPRLRLQHARRPGPDDAVRRWCTRQTTRGAGSTGSVARPWAP
ncbi:MAG TPA: SDR family NAD(P)-dependent oxidoreductase [Pseudonocardiaceae bacterium]|nr:SDR family NAD(P)-dependent oxidoreductase [Pseudonocardiaceae bacterium]